MAYIITTLTFLLAGTITIIGKTVGYMERTEKIIKGYY